MLRSALPLLVCLLVPNFCIAQVSPDALRHKEAGNHFLKQREYEKARDQYLSAILLEPGYEDAHYNLGVIYFFRLQDYPRALYHFVEYTRLHPGAEDLPQVRYLSIQALQKVEESDRRDYATALERGTVEALEHYQVEHPGSPYHDDAERKLASIRSR